MSTFWDYFRNFAAQVVSLSCPEYPGATYLGEILDFNYSASNIFVLATVM